MVRQGNIKYIDRLQEVVESLSGAKAFAEELLYENRKLRNLEGSLKKLWPEDMYANDCTD